MAWELLPTDYTDATWEGDLKYKQKTNSDGTVSFKDVTEYTNLEKCFFGAKDANRIDEAINAIMAALEDGTDLYGAFLEFFETQEKLFEEASDEQKAANQADFDEWFAAIKDLIDVDAAGSLVNEQVELEERLTRLEHMVIANDIEATIAELQATVSAQEAKITSFGSTMVEMAEAVNGMGGKIDLTKLSEIM